MREHFEVLRSPVVTERATNLKAQGNQYVFHVSSDASKTDVKQAVESLFKVKVLSVNTMNVRGKFRRMGSSRGAYRPDWKKAIVKVQAGQEIKVLEEAK